MYRTEGQAEEGRLYTVLQITKTASTEEVREAYKKAAKLTHPDIDAVKVGDFEEVNKAYTILANRTNRIIYNTFGDGILPLLQDHRVSGYIERIFSRRVLVLLSIFLFFFLLSTLFLPYSILLVSTGILPYYSLITIPHCTAYLLSVVIAVEIGARKIDPILFYYTVYLGLLLYSLVAVCLYVDGVVGRVFVGVGLAATEIAHLAVGPADSLQYANLYTAGFMARKILRRLCCVRYMAGAVFRVGQAAVFTVSISPYWRAAVLPAYILSLIFSRKFTPVEGVLYLFGAGVYTGLLAASCRNSLGIGGSLIIAGVCVVGGGVVARLVYVGYNLVKQAKWRESMRKELEDKQRRE